MTPRSRGRYCPSFASRLPPLEHKGRREGRVPADTRKTPVRRHCTRNARGRYRAADHPAFPARCLTAYGALSPETSVLFASVTSRIDGARCPVGLGTPPQGLAVATTARTTRFGRTLQRRSSARGRISRGYPALLRLSCTTLPRPPLPDPRFVATYDRPFRRIRMADTYAETEFR